METSAPKIGPVRRVNLTSQVMQSIKNYIVDNNLKPGDRLPTEKDLVAELGVSRNILREALKSLEAVGLIEIRVGDGMYVSDFNYAAVVNHISFAISRSKQELKHFMHARLVIEVGAIPYILNEITDEDFEELEEILERYDQAVTVEQCAKIDLEFHQKLLDISGNPILKEFGTFLGRFFIESLFFLGTGRRPVTRSAHKAFLQVLREGDLTRAQEMMREHILTWDADLAVNPADLGF